MRRRGHFLSDYGVAVLIMVLAAGLMAWAAAIDGMITP